MGNQLKLFDDDEADLGAEFDTPEETAELETKEADSSTETAPEEAAPAELIEETAKAEPEPEPAPASNELAEIREAVQQLRAENTLLHSLLKDRTVEKPEEQVEDQAAMLERLQKDPINTIREIAESAATKARQEINKELTTTKSLESQFNEERSRVLASFPELQEDLEFQQQATQIYNSIIKDRGYFSGALALAVSAVDSARNRMKKQQGTQTVTAKAPTTLRVAPKNPGLGKPASATTAKTADMVSFEGLSQSEQKAIQTVCKSWGISVENYMKRYNKMKKEDPSYGTGA